MPVTQELIENGRILQATFVDPWTIDEVFSLYPEQECIYNSASQPIHILIDVRQATRATYHAVRASDAPVLRHPMCGNIAIVGATFLVRIVCEAIFKVARFNRVVFFDTYEEGLAFLRARIAQESTARG
ncbi:MAG: hypothetical protein RML95_03295 [Anaerolineae bacterium]|nr:hypothetical protein [Anaerolineae bacterium]MDW8298342.1 hypothetical protein [Anaerolineae bacterium]